MKVVLQRFAVTFICCFIIGFFGYQGYTNFVDAKNYDPQKDISQSYSSEIITKKTEINSLKSTIQSIQSQTPEELDVNYTPKFTSKNLEIHIEGVNDLMLLVKITMGRGFKIAIIKQSDFDLAKDTIDITDSVKITDPMIVNLFQTEFKDYSIEQKSYIISENLAPILFKLRFDQINTTLNKEDWIFVKKIYRGEVIKLWESKDTKKLLNF